MENIVEVGLFVVMLCIVFVMFMNFFNKRNKISEKFSNVNTRKNNEEKRNTYVRRENKVNVSNNLNSNIHNNDRHYRVEDEDRYHRPIDAGTGLVTGLIVSEIIEDNLKISDVLNDSNKYDHEEVIREIPLSETIDKVEENTFNYNSNSFSSEPITEEKKVVEEITTYEEPSYKSYSSGSSYVAEEETTKSSFSSSSNYDSGSSSNYDSGSSSSDD